MLPEVFMYVFMGLALILYLVGDAVVAYNNTNTIGNHDTIGAHRNKMWFDIASGCCVLIATGFGVYAAKNRSHS